MVLKVVDLVQQQARLATVNRNDENNLCHTYRKVQITDLNNGLSIHMSLV